jgi:hypothetical protein
MAFYPNKINAVDRRILKRTATALRRAHTALTKAENDVAFAHGNSSVRDALRDNKQSNIPRRTDVLERKIATVLEEVDMLAYQLEDVLEDDAESKR